MDYDLHVSAQDFQVVWAALGEMPAKFSFALMSDLKRQVEAQDAAASLAQPQQPTAT